MVSQAIKFAEEFFSSSSFQWWFFAEIIIITSMMINVFLFADFFLSFFFLALIHKRCVRSGKPVCELNGDGWWEMIKMLTRLD